MENDPRCCGSGMCIIDNEGRCWCGQHWDGHKMCHAPIAPTALTQTPDSTESAQPVAAVAVLSP